MSGLKGPTPKFAGIHRFKYLYLFRAQGQALSGTCNSFLKRVESAEVLAFTSVFVLNEVLHQLMRAEIARSKRIPLAQTAAYLKANPAKIRQLSLSWAAVDKILAIPNLTVCSAGESVFKRAVELSKSFGLLATDGIHVAVMEEYGLKELASNDPDFKSVAWLELYSP